MLMQTPSSSCGATQRPHAHTASPRQFSPWALLALATGGGMGTMSSGADQARSEQAQADQAQASQAQASHVRDERATDGNETNGADGGGLRIAMLSIHGLIRGSDLELGRDADTGGQTKYVVEMTRALGEM